jgi:predicted NUDIX family NTP pyrophosphohydrolase
MYRFRGEVLEVLLGHMGGPFWARKDEGAWTIPKGEYGEGDDPFTAAKREFKEETGIEPVGCFTELRALKQAGGKVIRVWAFAADCDPTAITSNTFQLEWPRGSGRIEQFPEIDRAAWFPAGLARMKVVKGQTGFIDQLCSLLGYDPGKERDGYPPSP